MGQISAGGSYLPGANYVRTGAADYGGRYTGMAQSPNVISGSGATRQLQVAESGSLCLFDRAAGIIYTLPPPAVGLFFDFDYLTAITSNAAVVITNASTVFMSGVIVISNSGDNTTSGWIGNGSSFIKVTSNGTTTGGARGGRIRVACLSATVWSAVGLLVGSSTIATPFST